ncbi:MAG: CoA-binding protein [Rhodospirillaceae bacterium]|jgi:predicted CoA-binding protein|nr:CoA-binding protein [Rhodospirillaceae bacterium]MBT3808174.1 CoA-binding protein [Rhodospirillaceae bacterium]MBT4774072.1 CoA-binding protein [Rhodospirillaceae bacterium]MBT5357155.1 CoA-binding protein [Rhodospirillaceae bacterium]MBT5770389.1 CoA-binding protein [Rhodospirillaceae bacterium]
MSELYYPDWQIRRILRDVNTVAMVGASTNWNRPSYFAMKYMQDKGYRVIPVNPRAAGETLLGEEVVASLKDITVPIDMVDIFQRSERVPPVVDEAIEVGTKVIWMQLTVRHDEAAKKAEDAGITVIMDRCPKIEFARLSGELGWSGINTKVITSRRSRRIRA